MPPACQPVGLIALAASWPRQRRHRRPRPALSWGKPGVSYEDISRRRDRVPARRRVDRSHRDRARRGAGLRLASGRSRDQCRYVVGGQAIDTARPDLSIHQARDIIQARLDHCLSRAWLSPLRADRRPAPPAHPLQPAPARAAGLSATASPATRRCWPAKRRRDARRARRLFASPGSLRQCRIELASP